MKFSILFIVFFTLSYCTLAQNYNPDKLSFPNFQKTVVDKQKPVVLINDQSILQQPVSQDFYAKHLTFFCRQELKMQQVHIPLQIRVGSIDNSNYLEQKPGCKNLIK
ncbi:MAG TPA: hypothetical protein VN721_13225 [Flavipsychrobacter sp.]|nr:hypothetical protein [Flavipsychrobacter sp.]